MTHRIKSGLLRTTGVYIPLTPREKKKLKEMAKASKATRGVIVAFARCRIFGKNHDGEAQGELVA